MVITAGLAGLGPDRPSWARMGNYLLGGYDNFESDRLEAERVLRVVPELGKMAISNRLYAGHTIRWAASGRNGPGLPNGVPVGQVVDLGCGFPPSPRTHEIAGPGVPVAYVDVDLEVIDHISAMSGLGDARRVAAYRADLTRPAAVLGRISSADGGVVDLDRPVCLLLTLVLHMLPPDDARELVAEYARAVAPGSWVALSVPRFDGAGVWEWLRETCIWSQRRNYTPGEFARLFGGLEVVPPGAGPLNQLGCVSAGTPAAGRPRPFVLAGAGRKLLRRGRRAGRGLPGGQVRG